MAQRDLTEEEAHNRQEQERRRAWASQPGQPTAQLATAARADLLSTTIGTTVGTLMHAVAT